MKNIVNILFLTIFSITMYALTLRGTIGNFTSSEIGKVRNVSAFESSHERAPYGLMLSLVENNSFVLSKKLADFGSPDVGYIHGKFYILFAPGLSMLLVMTYILGAPYNLGLLASFALIPVFAIGSLIFLYLIGIHLFKLSPSIALFVCLVFGFGSTSWSYAITIYQHIPTTFFMLSAIYSAWKFGKDTRFGYIWALYVGIAYAFAILIDYPNILLMLPVVLYLIYNAVFVKRATNSTKVSFNVIALFALLSFILVSAPHALINKNNYGDWKKLSNSLPRYTINNYNNVLKSKTSTGYSTEYNNYKQFEETRIPSGLNTLLFSDDRGLFYFAPIFLLAILGILYSTKKFLLSYGFLLSIIVLTLFVYSSFNDPWGGWSYGPRYLIPSMAILSLFVGKFLMDPIYCFLSRCVAFVLFIYSAFIALLGALTTNIIPPKVEAIPMHVQYNFFHNIERMYAGKSGSFIYNEYFSSQMTLVSYALILYILVIISAAAVLFVLPSFDKNYVD